jgi:hypothetical protein
MDISPPEKTAILEKDPRESSPPEQSVSKPPVHLDSQDTQIYSHDGQIFPVISKPSCARPDQDEPLAGPSHFEPTLAADADHNSSKPDPYEYRLSQSQNERQDFTKMKNQRIRKQAEMVSVRNITFIAISPPSWSSPPIKITSPGLATSLVDFSTPANLSSKSTCRSKSLFNLQTSTPGWKSGKASQFCCSFLLVYSSALHFLNLSFTKISWNGWLPTRCIAVCENIWRVGYKMLSVSFFQRRCESFGPISASSADERQASHLVKYIFLRFYSHHFSWFGCPGSVFLVFIVFSNFS